MRGKFITIEGQDGAGKTTNVSVIKECLKNNNIEFIHSREPGGTQLGESVRELILNSNNTHTDQLNIGDKAELLLMFAARAQHIQDIIEPALSKSVWVLCDRFTDASYAYQGGGRGMPMADIQLLENYVQGGLSPDLTLLLDLPVDVGESRAGQRSAPDRFEIQKQDFKNAVRNCYLARANAEPNRIKVVDASESFEVVSLAVQSVVTRFIQDA